MRHIQKGDRIMSFSTLLLSVASVWGIAVITPGPNFLLTVQTAMSASRRATFSSVLGICTGTLLWACSGFLGLTTVFRLAPWTYLVVKLCGGGYLIYLGFHRLRSPARPVADATELVAEQEASLKQHYRCGLLTNLSNPKTAMFITSVFAATLPSHTSSALGVMSILLICSISFLWYTTVAYLCSWNHFRPLYQRSRQWIERCAGILFIGFGVKLATSK
jgi:RhtB (resistance to homoserine/threonine) family protein